MFRKIARRRLLQAAPLLAAPSLLAGLPRPARAADWPARPVRFIVSFTPGGTTDIIARLVGNALGEQWGQPVVVENRPGAGGNIGSEYVARADPDGYTVLVGSVGPLAVNQSLYSNPGFRTLEDFAPITELAGVPNILVVPASSPLHSVADLVAAAKKQPGKLSYGSTGVGTSSHLSGALADHMAGMATVHVPYRGAGALNDLLAGRVDFMYATMPSCIEHVRAGKLRALAVSSTYRSRAAPEVPTMVECGFPGFNASSWFGMVAPARTLPEVVRKIAGDTIALLRKPDIEAQMVNQGADPVASTPEEFRAFIAEEIARWGEVVKLSGAKAD
ncbi:tripartite tricarboxylate transporter substrate binding protein [Roseomonas sp. M0104]|uniref:Tripartite tricarboxylate transporter substrate binding protein n=1 Tax=Teichococcus coralli TaxID=2545983 RepID=A0A845B8P1_9PROT|nr:tripartite tricarboxylate transporter substrate binding protein [Pseudoroseomonas coralli]MXP63541.1 tripartite tricarboxylate transporter substrate binding protein [Pseudoroseomonas coralli]